MLPILPPIQVTGCKMEPSETGQALPPQAVIRFALTPGAAAALARHKLLEAPATPPRAQNLAEAWFDTPGLTLLRHGFALSTAKARRGHVQMLRQAGECVSAPIPGPAPDPAALPPAQAEALAALVADEALQLAFSLRTRRLTRRAGRVTLRFESGALQAGAERQGFCELELNGPAAETYALALALAEEQPLILQPASLAQRGMWAVGVARPGAVKAGPGLTGAICLDDAITALTQSCLSQFTANWPGFAAGAEVEVVHQMRVAMRRLRSVLGLFNRAFAVPGFAAFREEAKRIAATMGEARNWDVFTAMLQDGPVRALPHEPGFAVLLSQCAAFRAMGYAHVRAVLADPATTRFLLTVELFLARHGWRNGLPPEALTILAAPARDFAAPQLARLHRKVRKRGRHLAHLSAHDRHLTRIELKKLRYATDLFGGLFEGRGRVKTYANAAADLQEVLGTLNDLATAQALLARLDSATPETARASGIALGWCAHADCASAKPLGRSWKAFTGAKLFTG